MREASVPVRYAVGDTRFGAAIVAATPSGLAYAAYGDAAEALVRELLERHPAAVTAHSTDDHLLRDALALLDDPGRTHDLPLDRRATPWQQAVWDALQRTEPGTTCTYGELAELLGAPGAARAVASACASNPVAIAVPCHRVVRSDGSLSGYRWGVERKRAIIEHERRHAR